MAATMPTFLNRLFRPFTSSTRMGLNPEGGAQAFPEGSQKATVAAGCFWGVEHLYRKQFGGKGLLDARVGYIGGDTKSPSYRSVCSGRTGRKFSLSLRSCSQAPNTKVFRSTRRRGAPSNLRPEPSHIPPTPRVLLQNARPHDRRPARGRLRHAVPQRDLLP